MKLATDRRRRHVDPDPERVRRACAIAADYRGTKLRMAKVLVELERGGDHLVRGYSSVRDFAVNELGLPGVDVPLLLELGRALPQPAAVDDTPEGGEPADRENGNDAHRHGDTATSSEADESPKTFDGALGHGDSNDSNDSNDSRPAPPTVEDRVNHGALSMENAAQLTRLWRALGDIPEHERARWLRAAESVSPYRFRLMVRKAVEEAAQAERTVHLPLQVTESARDDFRRAKELASRRARRVLTEGQVFAAVVRSYVASEDQRRVGEKKRRVGSTKLLPGKRYVPAAVVRTIRERAGDRCEVPGCSNGGFLELMHVVTRHADGGAREVRDLSLGCSTHHVLLDAGVIRFGGWAPDGRPRFRTANGRLMGQPAAAGSADNSGAQPTERSTDQERCAKASTPSASRRARAPP